MGSFFFTDAAAFAVTSILLVGFRHLTDDGLGCLILFIDAAVFTAASIMQVTGFSVTSIGYFFDFRYSVFKLRLRKLLISPLPEWA